jgi:hypothetical protein
VSTASTAAPSVIQRAGNGGFVAMRSMYGNADAVRNEIQGSFSAGSDRIVPPYKFPAVCRVLWPDKTAFHLAAISGKEERTAKRWLAGEYEPPVSVVLAVMSEMFKRE